MKFQISTSYAVQILCYLHNNKKEVKTAQAIADEIKCSYSFIIKIMRQLRARGFLIAVQGRHGGYALKVPAKQISFYDVFACMEGKPKVNRCPGNKKKLCSKKMKEECEFHKFFCHLQGNIILQLKEMKISDLADKMGDKVRKETCVPHWQETCMPEWQETG